MLIMCQASEFFFPIPEQAQTMQVCLIAEHETGLAHSYLKTHKNVIGKQWRPRSDAT